ncbi:MAG: molecular chaperone, partial [Selenomonadaceae bacterium]|nr:molecular chaperone [Selenomonadaceae bacterium]
MQKLGFVLNKDGLKKSEKEKKLYYRRDLELMTVLELRDIARRENIISGIINPLQKDLLIDTILRYRGADAALLIKEYREEDYNRLTEAVLTASFRKKKDVSVEASARITLYQGLAADYYDEITTNFVPEFINTNAFLIDSEQNLCAVFNVKAQPGDTSRLYLIKSAALPAKEASIKRYFLIFFERRYSDEFCLFYNGEITKLFKSIPAVYEELLDFTVKTPEVLKMPAAIDFGSVNTVAGVLDTREVRGDTPKLFDDDTIYACFYDQNSRPTNVAPSIVGVVSLENPEKPKYCFGYDAVEESLNHIDEGFCVFYDMKRWVANPEKEEELTDVKGRRVFVKRKDIIREFFLYIIHSLENRIKCRISSLHLPSPVKQKEKFQRLFREILPEYVIEQQDMIDEGVSVLYNTISEMIESKT